MNFKYLELYQTIFLVNLVYLGYLGLSWAQSVILRLCRKISGYLRLSQAISGYQAFLGYIQLSLSISSGYLGLSQATLGYLELSLAISNYIGLCVAISGYPYQISRIRVQVQARESKLLPFETFSFLFFFSSHERVIEELALLKKT